MGPGRKVATENMLPHCKQHCEHCICWRPYRVECTGSLLTSEVKRHRARLVLGWGTVWEDLWVLSAFLYFLLISNEQVLLGISCNG